MNILKAAQDYLTGLEEEIDKKWITVAAVIVFVLITIVLILILIRSVL